MLKLAASLFTILAVWSAGNVAVYGDISLAKIFSDHMVLQRHSTVKVWGTAEPGDQLQVTFNGQKVKTVADAQGYWSTSIKTGVAGGPYELEVSLDGGEPRILITDVMIGEVWICSGQSNMQWPVSKSLNAETEIEQSKNYPNIRLFTVQQHSSNQPLNEFHKTSPWDCCSPDTVKEFSAVAYYFGRELHRKLEIPIGLINTSWGGTRCEAWTARSAMEAIPELSPLLSHWDENQEDLSSRHRPGNLFNAMISPLKGFSFRGVIWYQGEANVGRGQQYQTLLPALIKNWREELAGGKEFPFFYVQLAPFRYGGRSPEALPEVWDAQLKTEQKVNNTGMVVTTDIGDIKDIHPSNKQEVGRRLALWAAASIYDEELRDDERVAAFSGPRYESLAIRDNEVRVTFRHADDGLVARNDEPLKYFTVSGEDKVFHPAEATIDGNVIVLSSPEVPNPVAVRFAWEDTAEPNLYNKQNLPASPFRTDEFDLQSKDVHY